ncbi:MAG: hypothetical protein OEZ16_12975 [Chromatiales bacterium]|nr:hypothetical protein [Chromatiales bacterium]
MKLAINLRSREWWYWALTLICMIVGLAANYVDSMEMIQLSALGFYGVIIISIIQSIDYIFSKGAFAFPSQVREVYTLFAIIALFDPTRIFYWMLLVGTVMVTFFGRCIIARVLAMMPWNRGVTLTPPGEA